MSYRHQPSKSSESNLKPRLFISSVSSSTTLLDTTPSDMTLLNLLEDPTEDSHSQHKSVRFSAVDLEVVLKRKGVPTSQSQPRETGPTTYDSPPPPRPIAMTPQSSTLAAKHLSVQHRSNQCPPKISGQKIRDDNVVQSQATTVSPKANAQSDLKASHGLSSIPSTQSHPSPIASCRKPVHSSGPPKSTSSAKEITFRSVAPPSPSACADINNVLRRYLGIANFDFATYAQDRVYVVRKVYLASATSATPESSFPQSDGHSECTSLTEKSLSACFASSRLLTLSPPPTTQPDLFVIRYVGDGGSPANYRSGYCVFSLKEISTHQIILAERPCAIFPFVIALDGSHKKPYSEAFRSLSPELRNRAVHELSGKPPSFVKESIGLDFDESYDYEDIVVRNSLLITLDVPEGTRPNRELSAHRGLFLQASKIKHSCRANAVWFWDLASFSIIIRSVRPIADGEEITLAFVPPELSSKEREEMLMRTKGFKCNCESCKPRSEEGEKVEGAINANGNINTIQEGDLARNYLLRFRSVPLRWSNSSSFSPRNNRSSGQQPILDCQSPLAIINFKQWFMDKSISKHFLASAHHKALDLIAKEGLQILDTQQHVASPNRHLSPLCSPSLSPSALSVPLSRSSSSANDGSLLTVVPCQQRDVGFHIDMLVLCYGALGDTPNFKLYLEKAMKDRDERSAWLLISFDFGRKEDDKEIDDKREKTRLERNAFASNPVRLEFLKWAANPATFPLWGRRETATETTRIAGTATSGLAHGLELYDSLDDYALYCLAVST